MIKAAKAVSKFRKLTNSINYYCYIKSLLLSYLRKAVNLNIFTFEFSHNGIFTFQVVIYNLVSIQNEIKYLNEVMIVH